MDADPRGPVNAEGGCEPFHIDRVPVEAFFKGSRFGMRYRHLSSFAGGSQISVSMEELAPGRQANPSHYHLLEEEHVFVLEGTLSLQLGAARYELSAGHYVCFPAGQKLGHALVNRSAAPCRYLVFGNPQPHDVVVFPETGRVSVRLTGQVYRGADGIDRWDGVDVDAAPSDHRAASSRMSERPHTVVSTAMPIARVALPPLSPKSCRAG